MKMINSDKANQKSVLDIALECCNEKVLGLVTSYTLRAMLAFGADKLLPAEDSDDEDDSGEAM